MITLVTAFFNINRGDWKKFNRSSETYIESFSKWAHLKNQLIIYLEDEAIKNKVLEIRASYGLEKITQVYLIEKIESIDPDVYNKLKSVESNNVHKLWRYKPLNPEVNNADYNYVMYMKFWCLKHASEHFGLKNKVAWIDFGYAHNGSLFTYEEDFEFEWEYEFSDKVTLFRIKEIDDRPAFDIINTMDTYIMGCIFVVPVDIVSRFFENIREIMLMILTMGYMDDDQILLLIALRMHQDYICSLPSKWFYPVKQYGNSRMRTVNTKTNKNIIKKVLRKFKNSLYRIRYFKGLDKHLKKIEYK